MTPGYDTRQLVHPKGLFAKTASLEVSPSTLENSVCVRRVLLLFMFARKFNFPATLIHATCRSRHHRNIAGAALRGIKRVRLHFTIRDVLIVHLFSIESTSSSRQQPKSDLISAFAYFSHHWLSPLPINFPSAKAFKVSAGKLSSFFFCLFWRRHLLRLEIDFYWIIVDVELKFNHESICWGDSAGTSSRKPEFKMTLHQAKVCGGFSDNLISITSPATSSPQNRGWVSTKVGRAERVNIPLQMYSPHDIVYANPASATYASVFNVKSLHWHGRGWGSSRRRVDSVSNGCSSRGKQIVVG